METTREAGHSTKKVEKPQKPQAKRPSSSEEPSIFGSNLPEFIQFLKDTWQEFRKISWPTRQEVIKETWSVLVLVTAITSMVLLFDWFIARTVFEPLDKWAKKAGGGVGHTVERWGPLTPQPGAPVNNPNMPGNALPVKPMVPAQPAKPVSEQTIPQGATQPGAKVPASELEKYPAKNVPSNSNQNSSTSK